MNVGGSYALAPRTLAPPAPAPVPGPVPGPVTLRDDPAWRAAVAAYLDELAEATAARMDEGPPIRFERIPYFQGREAETEAVRRRKEMRRGHRN